MQDLFEKETQVLDRANAFLESLGGDVPPSYRDEFAFITAEYSQVLRQLRWVTRISDLTALGLNSDKMALINKVNIDALTEIYNRRFLNANLEHYLEVLENAGDWITVMMLDIDFFKNYNDTYGHPAGDVCLRKVANALHISLSGAEDFVVRYGGEEFIAVLPGADKDVGLYVAQKILNNIHEMKISHANSGISPYVTISIGLTCTIPKSGNKMQQYIDRADQALYIAKRNGRNQIKFLEFEEES